jgi:hypothetical protein
VKTRPWWQVILARKLPSAMTATLFFLFISFYIFLFFQKNIKENEKRDDSKVGCVVAHVNITIQPGRVHKGLGRYPNSMGRWLVPFQLS